MAIRDALPTITLQRTPKNLALTRRPPDSVLVCALAGLADGLATIDPVDPRYGRGRFFSGRPIRPSRPQHRPAVGPPSALGLSKDGSVRRTVFHTGRRSRANAVTRSSTVGRRSSSSSCFPPRQPSSRSTLPPETANTSPVTLQPAPARYATSGETFPGSILSNPSGCSGSAII